MSRNVKIILVVLGSLLVICTLSCVVLFVFFNRFANNFTAGLQTPEVRQAQARQIGAQIADYTLPPGYTEEVGFDMFVEKLVMIGPTNNQGPVIMMISVSAATVNRQQMEQTLRQSFASQLSRSGTFKSVGTHDVTIKGQQTTLAVSENDSTSGLTERQATGVFQGKSGLVMMMIMGSVDEWDWPTIEAFCSSIK